MEAFYVSMILFVSHAWDAVTDPLVGYLVSRSNWTPIGKLTPWLVGGHMFNTLHLELGYDASSGAYSTELTLCISQASSFHSVWCPVLSAAMVCATGFNVSGSLCAVVPHSSLLVRDPHECKSVLSVTGSSCSFPPFGTQCWKCSFTP